jgi:type IV pilus assembly protein PilM
MAKKLNSVLGIDIGSRKIKVAEVRSQGREPVVTALGMIDTPEGSVDHTGVYNSDAVGAALKQVLAESGASVPHAVISIAGQASVLVRTLEVPRMNPAELKEHMQWEINRNIPFAESTVVSDFQPLASDDPNSQNMDVVMAISPQSAIDMILACVKKAGKQTAAIDVEPLGLARSVKMSYDDQYDQQTVCVVDVGHKTTSINIFKAGKLLMPRQVPIGGEMFTKAVADAMGVGTEEAERLKSEKCQIPNDAAQQAGTFGPGARAGRRRGRGGGAGIAGTRARRGRRHADLQRDRTGARRVRRRDPAFDRLLPEPGWRGVASDSLRGRFQAQGTRGVPREHGRHSV